MAIWSRFMIRLFSTLSWTEMSFWTEMSLSSCHLSSSPGKKRVLREACVTLGRLTRTYEFYHNKNLSMPTAFYLCISYWLTHFVYLTCRFDYPDKAYLYLFTSVVLTDTFVYLTSRFDYPDKAYLYRDGVNHKPGYVNPDKDRPANLIGTGKLTIEKGLQVIRCHYQTLML